MFKFLKNWFEKNALLKILIAFLVLSLCIIFNGIYSSIIFAWVGVAALAYLLLTFLVFFSIGVINTLKDTIDKK